jgi:septal ring factor EnvC (AmiA/AmiB activator)
LSFVGAPFSEKPALRTAGLALMAGLAAGPAHAQTREPLSPEAREARQAELDAVARDIALTEERQEELRSEIAALDKDNATLNQTLIGTGKRVQALETEIEKTERRMQALSNNEAEIRASLAERRDVLAEVLGALQRMGRRPPPALLVRPEDALASVRSAILLGAVVPTLRGAAEELTTDLKQLIALRTEIGRERDRLRADATALAEDRTRIRLLLEEKRARRAASEVALAGEERKATALAEQATSLRELIGLMEKEIAAAARASAEADKAAAAIEKAPGTAPPTSLGNAGRMAPAVAFAEARGLLPRPVNGTLVKRFGDRDDLGATAQGISVSTRSSAQVNSPADGWVVYAGPFRSYGQLLIINAGGGYHVLLAGMERIDVQLGQFVLAGEPVAAMATPRLASAGALDIGAIQPVLYIEFRKDGNSIDPAPWWADSSDQKVGG